MVQVVTNLTTKESARKTRFEPTAGISSTDVQKAIEEVAGDIASLGPSAPITVVAAIAVIPASADFVYVNFAGTVTLTLPDSAAWLAAHAAKPNPLVVQDISGAASTNNITINRAGADTINGATSQAITSDHGGFRFRPPVAGKWEIQ